jgi:signal transduction histidine kinase/PAS domain-containing protein
LDIVDVAAGLSAQTSGGLACATEDGRAIAHLPERGLVRCDGKLRVLDADVPARRILTCRVDQLVGQPFEQFVRDEDRQTLLAAVQNLAIAGLSSTSVELGLVPRHGAASNATVTVAYVSAPGNGTRDRSDDLVLLSMAPMRRSGENPDPASAGATAIDERSPDLITRYRLWPEPGFEYVSPSALELLGYPPSAFYRNPQLLHELIEDPAELAEHLRIYGGDERQGPIVLHVRHRDGGQRILEQRATGMRDGEGRLLAIEAISRDVTVRYQEQMRDATSVAVLRLFHELCPSAGESAEPRAVLGAAAEAVCRHLDWSVGHGFLLDSQPGFVVSAAWYEREADRAPALRELTEAGPVRIEPDPVGRALLLGEQVVTELPDVGATERTVVASKLGFGHAVVVPVPVDGQIGAALEFFLDESTPPDSAVVNGVDEFAEQVGRALQHSRAVLHLRQLDRARQEFLARAAHELRGPLGSIALMAAALARQVKESDHGSIASSLELLADRSERISHLATRLLGLSQLEEGRLDCHPEPLAVEVAVRAALAARPVACEPVVDVEIEPQLLVLADPTLFDSILANLMSNAARHTTSTIRIRARGMGRDIALSVVDDGPGVSPELVPTLFEPIRAPLASLERGGLGLTLARRMAEAMGGTLQYADDDGGGACFTVQLPRPAETDGVGPIPRT